MAVSAVLKATRMLVTLLVRLAVAYSVVLAINRDNSDVEVQAAFRQVIL